MKQQTIETNDVQINVNVAECSDNELFELPTELLRLVGGAGGGRIGGGLEE